MKVTSLRIHNLGLIEHEEIGFNHPLLLFFGDVQQGKTTILNAVRWAFGGAFPSDIIRHGQTEGFVEVVLDDGIIRREFYVSDKDQQTKARDIMFMRNGRPVGSPVSEIKRLLNPFLSDQDYLRKMGETERKQYFAQMFTVDTTDLDKEYFEKDREASELRRKISGYGHIDLTPVPPSNAAELRQKLRRIQEEHAKKVEDWDFALKGIKRDYEAKLQQFGQLQTDANGVAAKRTRWLEQYDESQRNILELEAKLEAAKLLNNNLAQQLRDNPLPDVGPKPQAPDTAELEANIRRQPDTSELTQELEQAARNEERQRQLEENQKRADQKRVDEQNLKACESRLRDIKKEKIAKLKDISAKAGIPGLEFDEKGKFTYDGTQAGMLSTSQLMKLSSQLSALYPKGLGIELIDRAESLGKSVFAFIDKAKAEEKTILATIVGEAPANAPEEIGVFVVEQGKVTARGKTRKELPPSATPPAAAPTEAAPAKPEPKAPRQQKFI